MRVKSMPKLGFGLMRLPEKDGTIDNAGYAHDPVYILSLLLSRLPYLDSYTRHFPGVEYRTTVQKRQSP